MGGFIKIIEFQELANWKVTNLNVHIVKLHTIHPFVHVIIESLWKT